MERPWLAVLGGVQTMSTSREAFEAWAQKNWMHINAMEDAFAIWQAAMQHAYADAADVCKTRITSAGCASALRERAKGVSNG